MQDSTRNNRTLHQLAGMGHVAFPEVFIELVGVVEFTPVLLILTYSSNIVMRLHTKVGRDYTNRIMQLRPRKTAPRGFTYLAIYLHDYIYLGNIIRCNGIHLEVLLSIATSSA